MKAILFIFFLTLSLEANIGTIAALIGDAKIHRGKTSIKANIGAYIDEKDIITTSKRTRIQVILKDNTIITIGPKSQFAFNEYSNSTKKPKLNFRIKRGFFKAISGKIGKIAPSRFKIRTRSATIGIRGTVFMGEIGEDSEKIACLKGAITIQTDLKTFDIPKGDMIILSKNQPQLKKLDIKEFKTLKAKNSHNDKNMPATSSTNDKASQDDLLANQAQQELTDEIESTLEDEMSDNTVPDMLEHGEELDKGSFSTSNGTKTRGDEQVIVGPNN